MDDRVLEKKKGLNLMTKILITALIPLILIVVIAGVSIHSVGSVVARKLVKQCNICSAIRTASGDK